MSETLPLTAERLRELYDTFRSTVVASDWYRDRSRRYLDLLERVQGWSDAELSAPAAQKELWESRVLGSVGAGQNVNTTAVYTDQQVVGALVALRGRDWPEVAEARAQAVRGAYDEVMAMVHPRLSKRQPAAKLLRVFAALLPAHFHRCFDSPSQKQVARLVLGHGRDRVRGSVLVRDSLRSALGKEEAPGTNALAVHAERSFFCWWLHEHHARLIAGEQNMAALSAAEPTARTDDEREIVLTLPSFGRQRKGLPDTGGYALSLIHI